MTTLTAATATATAIIEPEKRSRMMVSFCPAGRAATGVPMKSKRMVAFFSIGRQHDRDAVSRRAAFVRYSIGSRFHAGDRSVHRPRVSHRPAAAVDEAQEVTDDAIELVGRFEIDRVAAVRHEREGGGRDVPLQE